MNKIEFFIKYLLVFIFVFVNFSKVHSQTLDESISFGLKNSATLSAASLEWASLREKLNQANAGIEMTGMLNGSLSQSFSGESGNYNNSHSDSISATLSKSLYDGGVADAQKSISQLSIDQKSLQIKILEQSVILEIVSIHLDTLVANFVRKLRERNLSRVSEQVEANKARYNVGAISKTVLAASEAHLARAQSQLIQSRVSLGNSVSTYSSLIGETPGELLFPDMPTILPDDVSEAEETALKKSMEIALAKLSIQLNDKKYNSLIASVMPTITSSLSATISDSTRSGYSESVSVSLSLKSPIFYTPSTSSKNRELVASAKALSFDLDEVIRKTKLSVKTSYETLNASLSLIKAAEEELSAAKIAALGVRKENEFGAKTILDVLDAEIEVVNAEINLWQAKSDAILSSFKLLASMGWLSTESLGLNPSGPQYNTIEIVAPPLPSPTSILKLNKWIN